jgi:hypothetical protein
MKLISLWEQVQQENKEKDILNNKQHTYLYCPLQHLIKDNKPNLSYIKSEIINPDINLFNEIFPFIEEG